jgi:hypothetical protein
MLDPTLNACLTAARSAFETTLASFNVGYDATDDTINSIVSVITSPWVVQHFSHWLALVSSLTSINKWQDQILIARVSYVALLQLLQLGPEQSGTASKPWQSHASIAQLSNNTLQSSVPPERSGPGSFPSFELISCIVDLLSNVYYQSAVELAFLHVAVALIDRCINKNMNHYQGFGAQQSLESLANRIGALKSTIRSTSEFNFAATLVCQGAIVAETARWFAEYRCIALYSCVGKCLDQPSRLVALDAAAAIQVCHFMIEVWQAARSWHGCALFRAMLAVKAMPKTLYKHIDILLGCADSTGDSNVWVRVVVCMGTVALETNATNLLTSFAINNSEQG